MTQKINLACGRAIPGFEDWINIDVKPELAKEYKNFICHDASKPLQLATDSVDVIFCEHFLEHLDMAEATQVAREVFRLLRDDGIFRVVVPDAILRKNEPPEMFPEAHCHKTAWTYISLEWLLKNAGFQVHLVKYWNSEGELVEKDRLDCDYGRIRRLDSLIVDGVK